MRILESSFNRYLQERVQTLGKSVLEPLNTDNIKLSDLKGFLTFPGDYILTRDVHLQLHNIFQSREADKDFASLFPPRTKLDLSIRRSRFNDVLFHARRTKTEDLLIDTLTTLSSDFDYITVLNIAWARYALGEEWWRQVNEWRLFKYGFIGFVDLSKQISNKIKISRCLDINKYKYIEMQNLSGYRNLPYPGFDLAQESRSYANGGLPHFLYSDTFDELADHLLTNKPLPIKYLSLREFIESSLWETAGSSSIGHVRYQDEGREGKFKARKNMLLELYTYDELYNLCINFRSQHASSIVKSELGKVRLAVSSDIACYLLLSWMDYLGNSFYLKWPGSTLQEDNRTEYVRMSRTLRNLNSSYSLPFDYQGFEHQPTTKEIQKIVEIVITAARTNVPESDTPLFDNIANRIINSFDQSFLSYKINEKKETLLVTGGLMSGLRLTSVIGNAWNTVMTAGAVVCANRLVREDTPFNLSIRGDDSLLISKSKAFLQSVNVGYKLINAIGGEGKFSIQFEAGEFLRVWYEGVCHGYPCRSLPGLVQRKPWTSEPWSPYSVLRNLDEVCSTIERRGGIVQEIRSSLTSYWCQKHHVPKTFISTPVALGGLGLGLWDCKTVTKPKTKTIDKPEIPLLDLKYGQRAAKLSDQALKLGISINVEQSTLLAKQAIQNTLATDDVPGISAYYHKFVRLKFRKQEFITSKINYYLPYTKLKTWRPTSEAITDDDYANLYKSWEVGNTYGSLRIEYNLLQQVKPFLKVTGCKVKDWMKLYTPKLYERVYHSRSHMTDVINWYGGSMSINTSNINPKATGLYTMYLTSQLNVPRTRSNNINAALNLLATINNRIFTQSLFYKRIYNL